MDKKLPALVVIAGKSCSGKDSVFNELIKLGVLERVVTYTTRPKRTGELDDVDYHFISDKEFSSIDFVEKREYNTANGVWLYGSSIEGLDSGKVYGMILTPSGIKAYRRKLGTNLLVIHIVVNDEERFERAFFREKSQEYPKYDELCRRWMADNTDFAGFEADVVVDNTFKTVSETTQEIEKNIKEWLGGFSYETVNVG